MVEYIGKRAITSPWLTRVCLVGSLALTAPSLAASPVVTSKELASKELASYGRAPDGERNVLETKPAVRSSKLTTPPFVLDDAQRARVALLVDKISEFDAAQLDAAAQQVAGATTADFVLAVLLRAGRPMPPGLSTARRAQRVEGSTEALAWLRVALTIPRRASLVSEAISAALDPTSPAPELSVAAMRVVAQLDLVAHALEIARWLEPGTVVDLSSESGLDHLPRMRLSAQSALHELYGRWFVDAAAFRAQWEILRGRSPDGTGRNELLAATGTANQRALTLIEFAPARLGHSLIDWPSSEMRANAARAIGRAVAAGALPPAAAREALEEGLSGERSEEALAARLRTLLDLTQGADPSGEAAQSVRARVFDIAERAKTRSCEEIWVMIGALTRLVHPVGDEADPARAEMLALGIALFERALLRGQTRSLDPDALQGAITSLSDVVRSFSNKSLATEAAHPLARLVRPMVLGAEGAKRRAAIPLRVRRAAANAFALSVQPSDARDLVMLVRSMETPELEYELLGALRAVIGVVEPGTQPAEDVINELFEAAAEPDFDSRARALELLLSDDVRPALMAKPRKTESRWALARLLAEPSPELRGRLAELLGLVGDESSLQRLITPDAEAPGEPAPLAQLAGSAEELVAAAARLANDLSTRNPTARARAAYLIAGADSIVASTDALLPMRARAALDLMLSIDLDQLKPAAERARALAWIFPIALELRLLMPHQLAAFFASSDPLCLKLRELAQPAGTVSVADGDPPALILLRSLMRADLMRAAAEQGVRPSDAATLERSLSEVMGGFDVAIGRAPLHGWSDPAITLESVELLRSLNKPDAAILRLEGLVAGDPGADSFALPAGTIRLFTELVLVADPFSSRSTARSEQAAILCSSLLQRPAWASDAADVRLVDLESAIQIASMLVRDELESQLQVSIASAVSSPEVRAELGAVDADRAAVLWKAIGDADRPR
ncbi:MAG: hypothetical protein ACJAQ3_001102 [Planctomycetota bacterium]